MVPISTRVRYGPWHVLLSRHEGGLPLPSVAKCEQITTLPRDLIEEGTLGLALSPARMQEVERAILRAIGVPA